jgi:WD40 repeat protein
MAASTGEIHVVPGSAGPAAVAVSLPERQQEKECDVFISYSRKDKTFAQLLYTDLGSYKPPKSLPVPQRYLKAFLDVSDAYGADYEQAIHARLKDAAKLLVVCSPSARGSRFVDPEIRTFLKDGASNEIISLIIDGLPNNEADGPADPRNAFPAALCEAQGMPLAIDYRGFDPRKHRINQGTYQNAWFTLLANIYGHSRADIEERERKRQARQRRIRMAILSVVGTALLLLSIWALWERDGAIAQRDRALAARLAAQANLLLTDPLESSPLPILLAAHSFRYGQASQATRALGEGVRRQPPPLMTEFPLVLPQYRRPAGLIFSPRSRYLAVMVDNGVGAEVFDIASGKKIASLSGGYEDGTIASLTFSRSETTFAVTRDGKGKRLQIFRAGTAEPAWDSGWRDSLVFADVDNEWRVASLGPDKQSFVVTDPVSGQTVLSTPVDRQGTAIALSPNGRFAASASGARVTVFDLSRRARTGDMDVSAPVTQLAIAPGGDLVAAVHADGSGEIWSVGERQRKSDLKAVDGKVRSVQFTPHGRYLYIFRDNGSTILDISKFEPVVLEQAPGDASAILLQAQGVSQRNLPIQVQFVSDEKGIFVARQQGDLILWTQGLLPSFGMFGILPGLAPAFRLNHGTDIEGASASEDATRVVSFGTQSGMSGMGAMVIAPWTVRVWDAAAGQEIARISNQRGLMGVVSPSGDVLATAEPSSEPEHSVRIRIWSLPEHPHLAPLPPAWKSAEKNLMIVGLDGVHLMARAKKSTLMFGTADKADTLQSGQDQQSGVPDIFGLSGDSRLAFVKSGSAIELFDMETKRRVDRIEMPRGTAMAVLSHDGRYVAVTLGEPEVFQRAMQRAQQGDMSVPAGEIVTQVWDRQRKAWAWTIDHRQLGSVRAVSDDGRRILVQRMDYAPELADNPVLKVGGGLPANSVVETWETGRAEAPLSSMVVRAPAQTLTTSLRAASFDRSGENFAAVLDPQMALVGSVASGEEIALIEPHGRVVATFDPAAVASEAKTAWGNAIGFSNDGRYLLTAGVTSGGSIFSWRYSWRPADLVAASCARLPAARRELRPDEVREYFGNARPQPICDGSSLERESDLLWDKLRRFLQTLTTGPGSWTVAPGKAALIVGGAVAREVTRSGAGRR